jgi:uncharacterized protein (DUF1501 family)
MPTSRREFLAAACALGLGPRLTNLGVRLAALGAAPAAPTDYTALVCIFLLGGNDSANMVLATDPDSWGRYQSGRNQGTAPIALSAPGAPPSGTFAANGLAALGGVLPITPKTDNGWPAGTTGTGARGFALHPLMPGLQGLFSQDRLAVVANVGPLVQPITKAQYKAGTAKVPRSLFSHNDQQSTWQAGTVEGARAGWGGQLCDLFLAANQNAIFTAISVSGNAVFLTGQNTLGYQSSASGPVAISGIGGSSLFGSSAAPAILDAAITTPAPTYPSLFEQSYAAVAGRSISAQQALAAALKGVTPAAAPPKITDPVSGSQVAVPASAGLQTILNLIAAGQLLGMKRQVFFLGVGGFDTHFQENNTHPLLMAGLDSALSYFYQGLGSLNGSDLTGSVTAFTMSDFSRTFTTNGSGTDHGWGGHHLVLGGAVKGGDIYGQYPTVGVDLGSFANPDGIQSGVWVPTSSVDQYAATLGRWMGASPSDLQAIFPNLGNFPAGLGFL